MCHITNLVRTIDYHAAGEHSAQLTAIGGEIKWALNDSGLGRHADDERLSGVYGTIIFDDLGDTEHGPHPRNVTVFACGRVDRSPCGSGTAARLALPADYGRLGPNQVLTHDSVIGTRFIGRVRPSPANDSRRTIIPEVEGMAYKTGERTFGIESGDPLETGFLLQ